MGKIVEPIGSAAFELIRNRIFEIIADELLQQAAITYDDDFLDSTIYMERFVPFDKAEMPAVNVTYAGMVPLRETVNTAHREYRYFVDIYGASPTTSDVRGDRSASIKVQRLMAVCDAILRDKRYITLAFQAPFIMNTRTDNMVVGNQNDTKDAANVVLGRLEFLVSVPENVQDIQPRTLDSYVTQVILDTSDSGYVFSGTNPGVLPSNQSTVYVNNDKIIDLDVGEDYNVRVLDTDTLNEVGAYDAYLDAWLIPTPGAPSLDISINTDLVFPSQSADLDIPVENSETDLVGSNDSGTWLIADGLLYVNNILIDLTVPAEGLRNIPVVDADTGLPVGVWDSYLEQYLISSGVSTDVYYNRPYLTQSTFYNDYDENWRKINGGNSYNDAIPVHALIQQIKPDIANNRYDYLKYFNTWGHKFRFFGENGGYVDEKDGLTYDKDGVVSVFATEFPVVEGASWWVYDGLTGYKLPSIRLSNTTWVAGLNATQTFSFDGVQSWLAFTGDESQQLNNNSNVAESLKSPSNRPFFISGSVSVWTGTTRVGATTHAITYNGDSYGGTVTSTAKTGTRRQFYFVIAFSTPVSQL